MIRQAIGSDFVTEIQDECAIRIHALVRAYGIDAPFIRYYADDCGGVLSILDNTAVLYCQENIEEWVTFVTMNPEIMRIHCSVAAARLLHSTEEWQGREGVVLKYAGDTDLDAPNVCETPYLPHVYALLSTCFEKMPALNAWYPDVSHRLRHNCSKIAVILNGEQVVSTAMTVAETKTAALIGQVGTHVAFRGHGYAKACIRSIISRCKGKSLYILPMTDHARTMYEKMGFVADGDWAELQRI